MQKKYIRKTFEYLITNVMKRTLVLTGSTTKLIKKIMRWHECPCSSNKQAKKAIFYSDFKSRKTKVSHVVITVGVLVINRTETDGLRFSTNRPTMIVGERSGVKTQRRRRPTLWYNDMTRNAYTRVSYVK